MLLAPTDEVLVTLLGLVLLTGRMALTADEQERAVAVRIVLTERVGSVELMNMPSGSLSAGPATT